MIQTLEEVRCLVNRHVEWRKRCLNLTASENITSPAVRRSMDTDLAHRYGTYFDDPLKRNYEGNRYIAQLETQVQDLAAKIFDAKCVDFRPLGGEMAGKAVIAGLTKRGDTVLETSGDGYGGHGVARRLLAAPLFEGTLALRYIPFNPETYDIDIGRMEELIQEARPRLIIFGSSQLLFPESIGKVKDLAKSVGAQISYDASHVLGLIAGGAYPNPIQLGADIVHGSTHKTFPGPQGGLIYTQDESLFRRMRSALYPALVTSHHLERLPAYAVQLLELEQFGRQYAQQVVQNARAVGRALRTRGVEVLYATRGFTSTHLILVDVSMFGGGSACARSLEEANIICGPGGASLPRDIGTDNKSGLRIGAQEVTRVGMTEKDMSRVAELIARVLHGEPPGNVAKDVERFVAGFGRIHYSFDAGSDAYPMGSWQDSQRRTASADG